MSTKSIVVEDEVWIGAGAIILQGVTIGRGAVIAAGAVVKAMCRLALWPAAFPPESFVLSRLMNAESNQEGHSERQALRMPRARHRQITQRRFRRMRPTDTTEEGRSDELRNRLQLRTRIRRAFGQPLWEQLAKEARASADDFGLDDVDSEPSGSSPERRHIPRLRQSG